MFAACIAVALRALARTWRVDRPPWPVGAPCVVAFWHGEQVPMVALHRRLGLTGMASLSRDGELLARVLAALGYGVVRGSSSRGAVAAFRAAEAVLRAGGRPALAVDGPRGPRGTVHGGAEALATATGAPVVFGIARGRGLRLRTWDRMLIPWPFARVTVRYGVWRPGEGTLAEAMHRLG